MHRAPRDEGIGGVVAERADGGEHAAPAGARHRDAAVGEVDRPRQLAIALDQEVVEAEALHFLGRTGAGADLAHVIQFAPLRRRLEIDRVALRVEMHLADEGGHQRHQQQHDQPGRIDQQADREADDGDDVLRLAQQLRHQRAAPRDLATRAVELVLQVGVLEVLEVERRGVFHQLDAGAVGIQLRQQRVDQADDAAEDVGGHRQRELQRQQHQQVVEHAAVPHLRQGLRAHAQRDQAHGLVDDQLADVQRRHRQQRARQPQQDAGQRQRTAGLPDAEQERRQVAQRREALAHVQARQFLAAVAPVGARHRWASANGTRPKHATADLRGVWTGSLAATEEHGQQKRAGPGVRDRRTQPSMRASPADAAFSVIVAASSAIVAARTCNVGASTAIIHQETQASGLNCRFDPQLLVLSSKAPEGGVATPAVIVAVQSA